LGADESAMRTSEPVFITGASGFVGFATVKKLIESGYEVRALVRSVAAGEKLAKLGIRLTTGDIRDRESIRSALGGSRYLFHVAADYRLWARDRREIFDTNVAGTRIVMEEALRAGVERVVYTSSVATLAPRSDGAPADESRSLSEREAVGAYKRSKIAAENLVRRMIDVRRLPAVIVNPSTPVGPHDVRPTPTGRMVVAAASGKIPVYVDTGLNLVHVDDVATGHIAALEFGEIGERYILGGQNVPCSQMLRDIAELVGRRGPRFRLPLSAALPIACAAEAMALMTGREPLATLDGVRLERSRMFFSSAKAERQLRFRARPYAEGLRDAVRWFRDEGYLPSKTASRPLLWFTAGSSPKASA
jgi:dihydroflavonol-4-reductase